MRLEIEEDRLVIRADDPTDRAALKRLAQYIERYLTNGVRLVYDPPR